MSGGGDSDGDCSDVEGGRSGRRLFPDDVAKIEAELLSFDVPREVTIRMDDVEYVSIQFYRWMRRMRDEAEAEARSGTGSGSGSGVGIGSCPNCRVHFHHWDFWQSDRLNVTGAGNDVADVRMDLGCPGGVRPGYREAPHQVLVGGCGESQAGTGRQYKLGSQSFDYSAHFHDFNEGLGPFRTTYAHMHLSPDDERFGLPEIWNVTAMARQLLRPPPDRRPHGGVVGVGVDPGSNASAAAPVPVATFIHNNCGGMRGLIIRNLAQNEKEYGVRVARYGSCLNNARRPDSVSGFDDKPCRDRWGGGKDAFFHDDCEATRDGTKTVMSSMHRFTFSLENTLSEDYFTEKRWQALLGLSVPVVWDNHNSREMLPDPDAALLVDPSDRGARLAGKLREAAEDYDGEYMRYFNWKKRGLRPDFVRKLFLSTDFLYCRICEHVAHHHGPGKSADFVGHRPSSLP